MIGVPETHRVQKSFWIVVAKLQRPTRSAINGLVNARGSSVANAQNISRLLINRIDIAEVQSVRRDSYFLPGRAAIIGAQDGAAGTTGPRDASADRADTAKSRRHTARLQRPLRRRDGQ